MKARFGRTSVFALLAVLLLVVATISLSAAWAAPGSPQINAEYAPGRLIVIFRTGTTSDVMSAALAQHDLATIRQIPAVNAVVVAAPAGQELSLAQQLRRHRAVHQVEPDYLVRALRVPNDPYFATEQWNLTQINLPAAWNLTTGAAEVIIAFVDTGVDLGHPDLAAKIVPGHDFVNDDESAQDDEGHGTHVAGIAAAVSDNGVGVTGVSWGARIMPVKALDSSGSGYTSDVVAGITWAADRGARIINLSLGGPGASTALQDAVNYAFVKGALIVAAAGNEYSSGSPTIYPAACQNVIGVAATNDQDGHASYSSAGSWVDVAAPGGDPTSASDPNPRHWIMSTYLRSAAASLSKQSIQAAYERAHGTSMSTPHVAGLAALVWSRHPDWTNAQVEWAIKSTAVDRGAPGRDNLFGYGRIDAHAAVALAVLQPTPTPTPSSCLAESDHPYANNTDRTWTITNPDPAAAYSRVHFSRIETESRYDFVIIRDGSGTEIQRLSGSYAAGVWSNPVPGATVRVQLLTDSSVTYWGFCADRIETTAAPPWAIRASLGVPRSRLAAATAGGKLYAIAGESSDTGTGQARSPAGLYREPVGTAALLGAVEEYDPAANTWTRKAPMPTAVSNVSAAMIDGKIYVPAGYAASGYSLALQVYDPATNAWTTRAPVPAPRAGPAVTAIGGKLYMFGGADDADIFNTCSRYDPALNAWSGCAAMQYPRAFAAAGVLNGKVYVAGGVNAAGSDVNYVEEYDPVADRWTTKAPMRVARGGAAAGSLDGYLYVAGGGWSSYLASVERYDPAANRWENVDPMNVGRRTLGLAELGGKLYTVGGWNGSFSAVTEAYTPPGPAQHPDIAVSPAALDATVPPGQTAARTLTISNTGQAALSFTISDVDTTPPVTTTVHLPPRAAAPGLAGLKTQPRQSDRPSQVLHIPLGRPAQTRIKVLIVTSDDDVSNVTDLLSAYPDLEVAVYDAAATPTLAQLQAHKVVVTSDNRYWSAGGIDPVALGNVLADYVDGGGKVIVANYGYDYAQWAIQGRFLDQDYGPFERATADLQNPVALGDFVASHPIMQGVTTLAEEAIHQDQTVASGAELVASWDDGTPLLAVKPDVVGLNLLLSLGNGDHNWTGDAPTLLYNAIVWLVEGDNGAVDAPWLTAEPATGAIAPGVSRAITVAFNAAGLAQGVYTANLLIASNDPDESQLIVPVTMTVGAPPARVVIVVAPAWKLAGPGGIFTLDLVISTGQQFVDAADAYLSFDPAYLRVVDEAGDEASTIMPAATLPLVLQNVADNAAGRIAFSAGRPFSNTLPRGDFTLATIRFKALAETSETGAPVQFVTDTAIFFKGDSILEAARDGVVVIRPPVLAGQVALQGRGAAPSPRWAGYDVRVTLYPTGVATPTAVFPATVDSSGKFTVTGMDAGVFDVVVKGPHSLGVRKVGIPLPSETLPIVFGLLLEGDANDDDLVAGDDFSILATAYATSPGRPNLSWRSQGWDPRADFNGDLVINAADFSLLATNYGRQGPIAVARPRGELRASAGRPSPSSSAHLWIEMSPEVTSSDALLDAAIWLETGAGGVDSADIYVKFDPAHLRVVDAEGDEADAVAPAPALPLVLQNHADSAAGRIAFSAGRQLGAAAPSGRLLLATIHFRALAATNAEGATVRFVPRTGVFSAGASVPGEQTDGVVVISPRFDHRWYLPQVGR
ncbi:MAG: hypothetical protein FJ011_15180 [Chloroflexi bacterium]|nr:hypothetical protein [Chloroflexota bacterium]